MSDFFDDHIGACIGLFFVVFFVVVLGSMFGLTWFQSCRQADVYNRINNTSWSCSDFFWAGKQINSQNQTIKLIK